MINEKGFGLPGTFFDWYGELIEYYLNEYE